MAGREWRCLARDTRTNRVARVYRKQRRGFTRNPKSSRLAKVKPRLMSKREADLAIRWGREKGLAVYATKSRHPWVVCDVAPPGEPVMRRLDDVGRLLGRYVKVISGDRTPYQAWQLRMRYLEGRGNLAALCCHISGRHTWQQCGKSPRSNHARGQAADCGVVHSGRATGYTNIGAWPGARTAMRKVDLCLPVPGENWHAEVGGSWRA